MAGILPAVASGGLTYRTQAGVCSIPPNVINAYCPAATFVATCDLTALPSDCTARIAPAQINAIVSELLAFAECLNPTGLWNCNSLNNLCAAFNAWVASGGSPLYVLKAGDTMTGPLYLPVANPVAATEAAHKAYVDSKAGVPAGGTVGQALVTNSGNLPEWGWPIDGGTY